MKKILLILVFIFTSSLASDLQKEEFVSPTTIEDKDFARAFLNIWLGEETSQPKLRNQILGNLK